VGFMLLDL